MIIRELVKVKHLTVFKTLSGCYTTMDGINEEIDLGNASTIVLPNPFTQATWTVWFKVSGSTLLFRNYNGGNVRGYFLHSVAGYRFVFANSGGVGVHCIRNWGGIPFNDGGWHNITIVYNGATAQLDFYGDGILNNGALTSTIPASFASASQLNTVGFPTTVQDVSQFAVWNRALSASEVLDVYNRNRYSTSYSDIPNLFYHLITNQLNPVDIVSAKPATSNNMDGTNIICET